MAESSGMVKVPDKTIKEYEEFVDKKDDVPPHIKWFVKVVFRAMGQSGTMPYNSTDYACPRCGNAIYKAM